MAYTSKTIINRQILERGYQNGYSDALTDILTALEDGGEDAVRQWISDNHKDTDTITDWSAPA